MKVSNSSNPFRPALTCVAAILKSKRPWFSHSDDRLDRVDVRSVYSSLATQGGKEIKMSTWLMTTCRCLLLTTTITTITTNIIMDLQLSPLPRFRRHHSTVSPHSLGFRHFTPVLISLCTESCLTGVKPASSQLSAVWRRPHTHAPQVESPL